jgi:hypothetical protein
VASSGSSEVVYDSEEIVMNLLLGGAVLLHLFDKILLREISVQHIVRDVQVIDRKVDQNIELLLEVLLSFEPLQAENQNFGCFVNLHLLGCQDEVLTFGTVPSIVLS